MEKTIHSTPFRLTRYYTVTSFVALVLVALVLGYSEHQQSNFFRQLQEQQRALFDETQNDFAKQQDKATHSDLVAIHEHANVSLAWLFANALWEQHLAPFVAQAQTLDMAPCRALPDVPDSDGMLQPTAEKRACFADIGQQIMAFPTFRALDAKIFDAIRQSNVFKIKVFDLRGLTIYSSKLSQIGEDKSSSASWRRAVDGTPTSELTFRTTLSALAGTVENLDLIATYLPVLAADGEQIVGVFEVYTDVTPFLHQLQRTALQMQRTATSTQARVQQAVAANHRRIEHVATLELTLVFGVLGGLYVVLFCIVSRAQHILRAQEAIRITAQQRLLQAEKMLSLGQIVAGIVHQLNTPLAFCKNNAQMAKEAIATFLLPLTVTQQLVRLVTKTDPTQDTLTLDISKMRQDVVYMDILDIDVPALESMLDDVAGGVKRMAEMVNHLKGFARLDRGIIDRANLNQALHSVVYLARSIISNRVEVVEEYGRIPSIDCNVSQLHHVFFTLIINAAQAIAGDGTVWVRTQVTRAGGVQIAIEDTGCGIPKHILPKIFDLFFTTRSPAEGIGLGLHTVKDIVSQHRGMIVVQTQEGKGSVFTVTLPAGMVQYAAVAI